MAQQKEVKPTPEFVPTGEGVKKAGEKFDALSAEIDAKLLEKKTSQVHEDILLAQDKLDADVNEIKVSIKNLETKLALAPAKSQEKKDTKLALEKERARLRKVEAEFNDKVYENTEAVRTFIGNFIKTDLETELTPEQEQIVLDTIAERLYDTTDRSDKSVG